MKTLLVPKMFMGFIVLLFPSVVSAQNFVGYAYDIETKKLAYTEHHQYMSETSHKVIYKEVDGKKFAEKTIDYQGGFTSPSIEQTNNRNGEHIKIVKKDNKLWVEYKENAKQAVDLEELNVTPSLVVDAGFDHFINQQWNTLVQGKELVVDYLVPSSLAAYQLSIQQYDCDNEQQYCFTISASNFFISMFADQLRLSYDRSTRKLISFQGRSNICDENGDYQDVLITYDYSMSKEASL